MDAMVGLVTVAVLEMLFGSAVSMSLSAEDLEMSKFKINSWSVR